jgi:hypothetical protein
MSFRHKNVNFNLYWPTTFVFLAFRGSVFLVVHLLKIYQHTGFQDAPLTGASFASTSEMLKVQPSPCSKAPSKNIDPSKIYSHVTDL